MVGKVTRKLEDRFFEKVKKTSGCWIWIANKNKKGYGRIWVGLRNEFAHRVSFRIENGKFNSELRILHRCDNPSCVNPRHLFLGDDSINQADKAIKGRSAKGEKNGNSKLSLEDVLTIRNSKDSNTQIAEAFGIDRTQVRNIRIRRQWKHV